MGQGVHRCFAVIAALIPFVLHFNYIVNDFYYYGSSYDPGLLSSLIWRNDAALTTWAIHGDSTYFAVHFSPFLALLNQLSYIVPLAKAEFYAAFMAAVYGLLSLAMYLALTSIVASRRGRVLAGLAALSIAFSFNGAVMQGVWMPHFEYAIPAGIFMFLLFHALGRPRWAMAFFVFTLSLREDAGLHLAGVLGLLILIDYAKTRSLAAIRASAVFAGIAVLYSLAAWGMTFWLRDFLGLSGSVFQQIYTGSPPYAHLTAELLAARLKTIALEKIYLWPGLVLLAGWSVYKRNPYWLAGYAVCLPWFLLNWTAAYAYTGTLYAYYAFPFVIALGFPVLAGLWQYGKNLSAPAVREVLLLQAALVCAGLVAWNIEAGRVGFGPAYGARWGSYLPIQDAQSRSAARDFAGLLMQSDDLGVVVADESVMALAMGSRWQNGGGMLYEPGTMDYADTVVYMNHEGFETTEENLQTMIRGNQLWGPYCVKDTTICLYTRINPAEFGPFGRFLTNAAGQPAEG